MSIRIRPATADDADALCTFARDVFIQTFGPDNTEEDLHSYVASAFTPAVQAAEIEAPGSFTLLAVDELDEIAAYALVALGAPENVEVGQDPIEIKRFYVGPAHHGRGLAGSLMDAVLDEARSRGARTVWLGVWERNARAIAFYHKRGFVKAGTQRFRLGGDLQSDWVMQNTSALR